MEDKWLRLEQVVRRVIGEELDKRKKRVIHKQKIVLNGQGWENISIDQMAAWGLAYPQADIQRELANARAWCVSNTDKAPRSEYGRFLNTWLKRAHNEITEKLPKQGKIKCTKCFCENWISISNGKCEKCR